MEVFTQVEDTGCRHMVELDDDWRVMIHVDADGSDVRIERPSGLGQPRYETVKLTTQERAALVAVLAAASFDDDMDLTT